MNVKNIKISFKGSDNTYTIVLSEGIEHYGKIQVNIVDNVDNKKKENNTTTIETSDVTLWAASL